MRAVAAAAAACAALLSPGRAAPVQDLDPGGLVAAVDGSRYVVARLHNGGEAAALGAEVFARVASVFAKYADALTQRHNGCAAQEEAGAAHCGWWPPSRVRFVEVNLRAHGEALQAAAPLFWLREAREALTGGIDPPGSVFVLFLPVNMGERGGSHIDEKPGQSAEAPLSNALSPVGVATRTRDVAFSQLLNWLNDNTDNAVSPTGAPLPELKAAVRALRTTWLPPAGTEGCDVIEWPPERESFLWDHVLRSRPAVLRGAAKAFDRVARWDTAYLKRAAGSAVVITKLLDNGEYENSMDMPHDFHPSSPAEPPSRGLDGGPLQAEDRVVRRAQEVPMSLDAALDLMPRQTAGWPEGRAAPCATGDDAVAIAADHWGAGPLAGRESRLPLANILVRGLSCASAGRGPPTSNATAYIEYHGVAVSESPGLLALVEDLEPIPEFAGFFKHGKRNLWLGSRTLFGLHMDPYDNILIQLEGSKEFTLMHPHRNEDMYEGWLRQVRPMYDPVAGNISWVMFNTTTQIFGPVRIGDEDDLVHFPRFKKAAERSFRCTVREGDAFFLPGWWWHQVRSTPSSTTGKALAANLWYKPVYRRSYPCQRCRLRPNFDDYRELWRSLVDGPGERSRRPRRGGDEL
eukprot:TRINITY_DN6962_c1_g1_i1.p1 TRINITY_DN6962_c1_g1~~TRINITY_DN6962_c1_g1_i1.p1  ORF type:complete len:632 (+),score=112.16 TRINITY_DN6962_c1_g1_i1:64-1959(+)